MPLTSVLRRVAVLAALAAPGLVHALNLTCVASTLPVVFGNYSASSALPNDTTGTVTITCLSVLGSTVSYTVALSSGGGSYGDRQMSSGANALHYQLYTDLGRSAVWGDGIAGGTATVSGSLSVPALSIAASDSKTVYGRIPTGQTSAPAAAYTDTITVTVTY